jgi:hypothetical protein
MALTATAKGNDIKELQVLLHSETNPLGVRVLQSSFFRGNLYLEVRPKTNEGELVTFVKQHTDAGHAGIVYCGMRDTTVLLAGILKHCGVAAAAYHAGIESAEKQQILYTWQQGNAPWHLKGCMQLYHHVCMNHTEASALVSCRCASTLETWVQAQFSWCEFRHNSRGVCHCCIWNGN